MCCFCGDDRRASGEPNNGGTFYTFAYVMPARLLGQSQSRVFTYTRRLCRESGCLYRSTAGQERIGINYVVCYQFSSVAQLCPSVHDPVDCNTPGLPVHHQLLELPKLMSIESVMPPNNLNLCRPLLLVPSIFPSLRVFSSESTLCIKWPKY